MPICEMDVRVGGSYRWRWRRVWLFSVAGRQGSLSLGKGMTRAT